MDQQQMTAKGSAKWALAARVWWGIVGLALSACAATPPPKVVYEDRSLSIRLAADNRSTGGHSHPALLSTDQLTRALGGIRLESDSSEPIGSANRTDPVPAFSAEEIRALGPLLIKALGSASPDQIVTFYRAQGGETFHRTVTSGGLFVQDGTLCLVLANYHTKTDAAPREEAVAGVMDVRDHPLIPVVRGGYRVGFQPSEALVPPAQRRQAWAYPDDRKLVTIDLRRLGDK
jgi:hypothetical protein